MRRREFLGTIPLLSAFAAAPPAGRVQRWAVVTIGNLSRNHYWGESDAKPLREAICTTTLISGEGFHMLVDPSIAAKEGMAKELDRRTGLKLDDITAIFVTHEHGDHWAGIENFPKAAWYTSAGVAKILNGRGKLSRKLETAPDRLFDAMDVIPTPGHTPSHHGVRFDYEGKSIVAAGDAVPTVDYWRERRSYYNAVDPALCAKSMDKIASIAAIVIPGHDNYFLI